MLRSNANYIIKWIDDYILIDEKKFKENWTNLTCLPHLKETQIKYSCILLLDWKILSKAKGKEIKKKWNSTLWKKIYAVFLPYHISRNRCCDIHTRLNSRQKKIIHDIEHIDEILKFKHTCTYLMLFRCAFLNSICVSCFPSV